jgi:hypothetical protein
MSKLPWPFIGAEALSNAALPERALRRSYDQLYPGVFVPRGVEVSARQRAEAAWLWSKRRGVVAGQSAAALLGAKWVDGRQHAELIHDNRKPPACLIVRTETLSPGEALGIGALQVTTPARTAFDIGRHTLGGYRRYSDSTRSPMPRRSLLKKLRPSRWPIRAYVA